MKALTEGKTLSNTKSPPTGKRPTSPPGVIPETNQERFYREKPLTRDELIILSSLVMSRLSSHTLDPGVFVDIVRENRILLYKLNKLINQPDGIPYIPIESYT